MKSVKYSFKRGPFMSLISELDLKSCYLASYKTTIEKQLATFLAQIVNDEMLK